MMTCGAGRDSGRVRWDGWNESEKLFEDDQKLLVGCHRAGTLHSLALLARFGHLPCRTCRNIMGNEGFSEETKVDIKVAVKGFTTDGTVVTITS